jgi:hypothetical protein
MVDRDTHGRIMEGGAISKRGPPNTTRFTIKLDRLIVLSKSSLLGWFLHVSLILIIKGRYPREVSLIQGIT